MLKSVVMAYHFIGPDGPTDTDNNCLAEMFLFEFDLIGKICSIWSFWMKYLFCQLTKSFSDCPPKNGFAMGRKLCQSQGQGEPRVATISVVTLFWRRTLNHIREHTSQPWARKTRTRKSPKPGTGSILLVISTVSVASKDVGTHILLLHNACVWQSCKEAC